jgi:hypothetical protein
MQITIDLDELRWIQREQLRMIAGMRGVSEAEAALALLRTALDADEDTRAFVIEDAAVRFGNFVSQRNAAE